MRITYFVLGVLVASLWFVLTDSRTNRRPVETSSCAPTVTAQVSNPVVPEAVKPTQVWSTVTAYCPCKLCCGAYSAAGKTSTGRDARTTRGVAVDPKMIQYGSLVTIPGASPTPFRADDTGGAMRQAGKRGEYLIDLRFHDHRTALEWGRRRLLVTIQPPPNRD